ncbi:OLC1v1036913C1 [Oldenlandia corymbosa var. corymbosa]|uniref:OLC1v1036913C1 n=1 Tax=Oldenlandia corymbosa var. corymbosa TaxID=529605 RepID=A0AAV1D039_OLDCO|nr:OLC1v1036913C1 [Oldenlandia corymbosa var. corymbosa]
MDDTESRGRVLTSFKVVIVSCKPKVEDFLAVEIFSSETWEWAPLKVHSDDCPILIFSSVRPVVRDNILYYTGEERTREKISTGGIIAYDPYMTPHKLRFIEIPKGASNEPESSNCGVSQGLLKFCQIRHLEHGILFNVWQLQEEDNKWCLQHTIRIEDIVIEDQGCEKRIITSI